MNLPLAGLEALEERRAADLRHRRFDAALVASAILNVNRVGDVEPISPFDFLSGYEDDPEEVEREQLRRSIKHAVTLVFMGMTDATPEAVEAQKVRVMARLRESGVEDPEELMREVFHGGEGQ